MTILGRMLHPTKVTANLRVPEGEAARAFHTDFLGLTTTAFDLGWWRTCSRRTVAPRSSS